MRQKEWFAQDESVGKTIGCPNIINNNSYCKLIKKVDLKFSFSKVKFYSIFTYKNKLTNTYLKFIKWLYLESIDIYKYIYYIGIE